MLAELDRRARLNCVHWCFSDVFGTPVQWFPLENIQCSAASRPWGFSGFACTDPPDLFMSSLSQGAKRCFWFGYIKRWVWMTSKSSHFFSWYFTQRPSVCGLGCLCGMVVYAAELKKGREGMLTIQGLSPKLRKGGTLLVFGVCWQTLQRHYIKKDLCNLA